LIEVDIPWEELTVGSAVSVTGVSKGKGFAGAVKRYSFAGGPKTHGQSDRHRAVGSIGAGTFPGKVWKGKKMPGRMGNQKVTVSGLRIVQIVPQDRTIFISGAVPGGPNSEVIINVNTVSNAEDSVQES
jgi:large subunit ribosomal protein L3